ncbi:MAG: DUF2974 domain-containing protein, partial [Clostridia bacterium]|nr:DUF2974 domain-containing protein [Clostridia bacterium]
AASVYEGPLLLLGHSKGGNLAIYAAAEAEPDIKLRIEEIFNTDGPGFLPAFIDTPEITAIRGPASSTKLSEVASFLP